MSPVLSLHWLSWLKALVQKRPKRKKVVLIVALPLSSVLNFAIECLLLFAPLTIRPMRTSVYFAAIIARKTNV